jgi:hypothetical protein
MNIAEMAQLVEKGAIIEVGGLSVNVFIKDVKRSYGRARYQVTPVSGGGLVWVEKITLLDGRLG